MKSGTLTCITAAMLALPFELAAQEQEQPLSGPVFTTLLSFDGTNGSGAIGGLVQGTDGSFYGLTFAGPSPGDGTVFKITPGGTLTTLHNFSGTDGEDPQATLVLATDRNFYGTTQGGGTSTACGTFGCGTIFKITPMGTLTTLHDFDRADGQIPDSLVQTTNGDFYGTTLLGGFNASGESGCGTLFKINSAGTLQPRLTFDSVDGAYPNSLIQGANGDFYGTTGGGGTSTACTGGCGTIFKIYSEDQMTTLVGFDGTDGSLPFGALVQATNGDLYGVTSGGGTGTACTGGCGTVFKVNSSGVLTTLHNFAGYPTDGAVPYGALIQATDGNFYGTTEFGGTIDQGNCGGAPMGCGTVFRITPDGTFTTLHNFKPADGMFVGGGLLQATNGTFYGTAQSGGAYGDGTIYSLSVGLGPFVKTVPTSGTVGAAVSILGTHLTGTTSVTFNGTAVAYKVVSPTLISTAVPAGATSGKVEVTTPSGTLKSNVGFRVLR